MELKTEILKNRAYKIRFLFNSEHLREVISDEKANNNLRCLLFFKKFDSEEDEDFKSSNRCMISILIDVKNQKNNKYKFVNVKMSKISLNVDFNFVRCEHDFNNFNSGNDCRNFVLFFGGRDCNGVMSYDVSLCYGSKELGMRFRFMTLYRQNEIKKEDRNYEILNFQKN